MKKTLILTTALVSLGFAANADVTVMSWGGAYGAAQTEAHVKPFIAATGNNAVMVDSRQPGPADQGDGRGRQRHRRRRLAGICRRGAPVRRRRAGADRPGILRGRPDGTPAAEDFFPGAVTECGVSTDTWANVYAYDTTKFPEGPTTAADFFDLAKFPGKRGLRKGAKADLEFALMATAWPRRCLCHWTPEGVDRAFAKLDTIKKDVVWWEAGAQAPQLLADGEVVMTTAYNGRIFGAAIEEGKPFQIVWDGQIYENELLRRAEGRAEQGPGDGVHRLGHHDRGPARPGAAHLLRPAAQVGQRRRS
jgi:putative spermidine/putrescine transport system substrate-binding protein